VAGSALLVGGDPGIGKSTLLLQAMGKLAKAGVKTAYVSGEESVGQVRRRAKRRSPSARLRPRADALCQKERNMRYTRGPCD